MAELADALDSGSNGRKAVQVQVLLPAPSSLKPSVNAEFERFFGVFRRENKPPVLLGEVKTSRATTTRGEASAKPQRNIGKN